MSIEKTPKSFLFVLRRAPQSGYHARETLDQILATAAFDQTVRILLLDDGVYQVLGNQRPVQTGIEPITPLFDALELFDVDTLWVEQDSLAERGLEPASLAIPVQTLARRDIPDLFRSHDILVGC